MRGTPIRLSPCRRFICDLVHSARAVPTVPVQRRMRLAAVVLARNARRERPAWAAIFTKAYARVALAMPALRRAYVKIPWPHLYEYPASVASIAVDRDFAGEKAVFVGRIKQPELLSLAELTAEIRYLQDVPIADCKEYQRVMRLSAMPWPIRRSLWWLGLNIGRQRGNYFGTFAVSVYSALGAESLHPLSPLTTTLNYGVIAPDGNVNVRIIYDHRVMDGTTVASALERLETELTGGILAELRSDSHIQAAQAEANRRSLPAGGISTRRSIRGMARRYRKSRHIGEGR
jgi:hypothetical protein